MNELKLMVDLTSVVKSSLSVYSKNLLFTGVVDREGHRSEERRVGKEC